MIKKVKSRSKEGLIDLIKWMHQIICELSYPIFLITELMCAFKNCSLIFTLKKWLHMRRKFLNHPVSQQMKMMC